MQMMLSDADFNRLVSFVQKNYGINLTQKRQLIVGRLSTTLTTMGFNSFTPFIDRLISERRADDVELVLNKLTTNYTYFMREIEHFNFFKDTILPEIVNKHRQDRTLSIWSAGCSSGEEPYTISMFIKDYLGTRANEWDTRVLATDISQRALMTAKAGVYELPDSIKPEWKRRFFVPDEASGHFRVSPEIKNNVVFRTFNLMGPIATKTQFDVIFCRNVMIYFDKPTKDALIQRFYNVTAPGGYLLIGHSETADRDSPYQSLAPATYRKPAQGMQRR